MNVPKIIRNKYFVTSAVFIIYILFLDDTDIFTVYSNLNKRSNLIEQNEAIKEKLASNRIALQNLDNIYYLEHYARSKKFFKAKDEDIFVIIPNDSISGN
ncbi:MAG: hypothetical protein ACKO68_03415 [Bacteroidota bacterium]